MIKVLHAYARHHATAAQFITGLCQRLPENFVCEIADEARELKRVCTEWHPDIVHVYGNDWLPCHGARLVISPSGATAVGCRNYYVMVARSPIEQERLEKLGCPRLEQVRNPLITKTTTFEEAAASMSRIYQKVMDTNVLELMSPETRHLLSQTLKAAITGDARWVSCRNEQQSEDVNFRQLFIYAEQEGVLHLVEEGLRLLKIAAPPREITDSYLPEGYHSPEPTGATDIVSMLKEIQRGQLSLLLLTAIDRALRNDRLNEDKLLEELKKEKLYTLFQGVLQLLSEQTLLDEGFMPCPPADNRETQRLRTILTNNLKL